MNSIIFFIKDILDYSMITVFNTPDRFFLALTFGILPALLWLWFWLHEDRLHPEPRKTILFTFLAGMLVVPFARQLEQLAWEVIRPESFLLVVIWSGIEELLKFFAAFFPAILSKYDDEPVDAVIYMITAALGFAAYENALYLANPDFGTTFISTLLTGNLRFMGATLLHVISSASIGMALGFAFFRKDASKITHWLIGFFIALTLHSFFNFFIMGSSGQSVFIVFYAVWVAILVLFFFFEKLKKVGIKPDNQI